jgi:hypothetical protein
MIIDNLDLALIEMGDEALQEGLVRALVGGVGTDLKHASQEMADWFKGVHEKQRAVQERGADLIAWLDETDKDHPGLSLDMGSFFSWLKTSHWTRWRFYFLLNDSTFGRIAKDIKDDHRTELEDFVADFETFAERKQAARVLENARTVKDLKAITQRYLDRCDQVFKGLLARKSSVNGAPYHVMALGLSDLDATVKNIVRLAK